MEIDKEKETEKLKQEITALQQQLAQVQQQQNELTSSILKKVGAVEFLGGLGDA